MDMITLAMAKAYSDSKGGYVEKKYYYPTVTVPFVEAQYPGIYVGETAFHLDDATPGDILTVMWDGTEYKAEVGVDSNGHNSIGNPAIAGGEDNGLPFAFSPRLYDGVLVGLAVFTFDNSASHTIAVYHETIHPIDQKYLPGVCLPVVELSTTFNAGSQLTDEENKILTAAFEKNTPVVIKCNADVGDIGTFENTALVWCPVISANIQTFATSIGGLVLQILDIGSSGKWLCNVQSVG